MDLSKLTGIAQMLGSALRKPASVGSFAETEPTKRSLAVSFSGDDDGGWGALRFDLPPEFELKQQLVSPFSRLASFQAPDGGQEVRGGFEKLGHSWMSDDALRALGVEPKGGVCFIDLGAGARCMVHASESGVFAMVNQTRTTEP